MSQSQIPKQSQTKLGPTRRLRARKTALHAPQPCRAAALLLALSLGAASGATNTVINLNGGGTGSLRQAVASAVSGDVILFAPGLAGQTILLTNGQILLAKNLLIDAAALPGGIQISGGQSNRVFEVVPGIMVTLSSLTIRDGYAPNGTYPANAGGGILNRGSLTLTNCTVLNNKAVQGISEGGGGIENYFGTLVVNNSTVVGNFSGVGGGIESYIVGPGSCTLNQCTLAGNAASSYGGGLYNGIGVTTVNQCTLTGNSATNSGGGIANYSTLNLFNSIVAGNSAGFGGNANITGSYSPSGKNFTAGDPVLAPLGNYGGPTQTQPPVLGSPVIDAGAATTFATDQRGLNRLVGNAPDIGAAEAQAEAPVVLTSADTGGGSLRYAIIYGPDGSTITFATNLNGATIQLTSGEQLMSRSHAIDASALPDGLTINGSGTSRLFQVPTNITVTLDSLTLTNGNGSGGAGGAILNRGNLTVNRCTLAGNSANGSGGGLWNNGTLTMNQCTLFGNSASGNVLAAWTFETSQPASAGPFNPEIGSGSATGVHGGSATFSHPTGNGSSNSFTANGWAVGDYFQFAVSTLGQSGLTVSWDQVSSVTGPRDFRFLYSTNGTNFFQVGANYTVLTNAGPFLWNPTNRITATSYTNDLSAIAALNNQATVFFRLVDATNIAAGGGNVQGRGVDSVDNFVVRASGTGGGLAGTGTLAVNQSTLTGNSASDRGGGIRSDGTLTLSNSIVAGNNAPAAANVSGVFSGANNLTNGAPQLAALGDFGGPTPTMPPLLGSPALDAGGPTPFTTDQRGLPRLSGSAVDIGAVELQVAVTAVAPLVIEGTWLGEGGFNLQFTNLTGARFTVLASTNAAWPAAAWSNVGAAAETPAGSGRFQFTDPQTTNFDNRFYRVRSP